MQFQKYLSSQGIRSNTVALDVGLDVGNAVNHLKQYFKEIIGVVLDYNCPRSMELIEAFSNNGGFIAKNKWLLYENTQIADIRESILLQQLNTTNLYIDSEISYFNFAFTSKYGNSRNSRWVVNALHEFLRAEFDMQISNLEWFYRIRGISFIFICYIFVSAQLCIPFMMFTTMHIEMEEN